MIGENLEPIKLTGEALFDHLAANNPAALAGFLNQTAQLASLLMLMAGREVLFRSLTALSESHQIGYMRQ